MQKAIGFIKQNYTLVIVIVMVIVGVALYANTFHNKMFWDDNDFILNNQFVHDWSNFPKFFSQNLIAGAGLISNYWRPALLTMFSFEWHIWHGNPLGYHITNTLIHIADAILLTLLISKLFKNKSIAFFAGLIFLIHPLQTEAVTYVNSLGDSLSVLFIASGLLLYLKFLQTQEKPHDSTAYLGSVGLFILALMSKETAIIMPALIFLVDFFFQNADSIYIKIKNAFYRVWPYFTLALFYIILRATALNFNNSFNLYGKQNLFTTNILVRIFTFFKILTTYIGLLFWPNHLHMERSMSLATSLSPAVVLGGLIFFLLLGLAIWKIKKYPILSFGIFWFFICLAPTSNIAVPINGLLYEHWLYLPMFGFWLSVFSIFHSPLMGEGGARLAERERGWAKRRVRVIIPIYLLIATYVFIFSFKTISRNHEWRDPINFYNQTLTYAPNSYRIINNLGMAYSDTNDFNNAKIFYEKAIALDPANAVAYHNLGNLYKENGKKDLAIHNFNIAIQKDPKFIYSYNALAQLYLDDNDLENARNTLKQKSDNIPDLLTFILLSQISIQLKDYSTALDYAKKAQVIDPGNSKVNQLLLELPQP